MLLGLVAISVIYLLGRPKERRGPGFKAQSLTQQPEAHSGLNTISTSGRTPRDASEALAGDAATGAVELRIQDGQSGRPIPGARIHDGVQRDGKVLCIADEAGRAILESVARSQLTIQAEGYALTSVDLAREASEPVLVELLPHCHVVVRCVTVAGLPVSEADVILTPLFRAKGAEMAFGSATTEEGGVAMFNTLLPGRYQALVIHDRFVIEGGGWREITVASPATEINLTCESPVGLRVHLPGERVITDDTQLRGCTVDGSTWRALARIRRLLSERDKDDEPHRVDRFLLLGLAAPGADPRVRSTIWTESGRVFQLEASLTPIYPEVANVTISAASMVDFVEVGSVRVKFADNEGRSLQIEGAWLVSKMSRIGPRVLIAPGEQQRVPAGDYRIHFQGQPFLRSLRPTPTVHVAAGLLTNDCLVVLPARLASLTLSVNEDSVPPSTVCSFVFREEEESSKAIRGVITSGRATVWLERGKPYLGEITVPTRGIFRRTVRLKDAAASEHWDV